MAAENHNLLQYRPFISQADSFIDDARRKPLLRGFIMILITASMLSWQNLKAQISFDTNEDSISGINSLMNATVNNDLEGVKFYAKAGGDIVNQKNLGGATPLHLAARNGYTDIASILIENGANVNSTDNEQWTPLMRAATSGNPEIMALLLDKGADAKKTNIMGETAIIHAADANCTDCINLLFSKYNFDQMDQGELKNQINQAYTIAGNKNNSAIQNLLSNYLNTLQNGKAEKAQNQAAIVDAISNPAKIVAVEEPKEVKEKEANTASNISSTSNNAAAPNKSNYHFLGEIKSKNQSVPGDNEEQNISLIPSSPNIKVEDIAGSNKANIPAQSTPLATSAKKYVFKKLIDNNSNNNNPQGPKTEAVQVQQISNNNGNNNSNNIQSASQNNNPNNTNNTNLSTDNTNKIATDNSGSETKAQAPAKKFIFKKLEDQTEAKAESNNISAKSNITKEDSGITKETKKYKLIKPIEDKAYKPIKKIKVKKINKKINDIKTSPPTTKTSSTDLPPATSNNSVTSTTNLPTQNSNQTQNTSTLPSN